MMTSEEERDYKALLALIASLERNLLEDRVATARSFEKVNDRINDVIRLYITSDRCNLRHEEGTNREAVVRDGNEAAHQRIIALTNALVPKAYFILVAAVVAVMGGLLVYILNASRLMGGG